MEFQLLEPFEVRVDATPQPLAGRGERALLALLALSPGKAVAITTLIDALWNPGDLPHDPANALQLRVSSCAGRSAAWAHLSWCTATEPATGSAPTRAMWTHTGSPA